MSGSTRPAGATGGLGSACFGPAGELLVGVRWCTPRRVPREREAGFFLLEAVIAIALIAVCAGSVLAAIVAMQHQAALAEPSAALTLDALNVLTDLRAVTAYDPDELAALAGRSAAFDVTEPLGGGTQRLHVVVTVIGPTASQRAVASVTVRNAQGQAATAQRELAQEAPPPDFVLEPQAAAPNNVPSRGPAAQ